MTEGWIAGPPPFRYSGRTAVPGLPTSEAVPVSPGSPTRVAEQRHTRQLTQRRRIGQMLLVTAFGAAVGIVALTGATRALFSDSAQKAATVGAGHISPGTRSTSAFSITDRSGGSAVDRSSVLAYAGDGRTTTTSAWSTAFASDRYLQFDFNDPLPAGLSTSAVTFRLLAGGTDSGASECAYVELRRASDDGLIFDVRQFRKPAHMHERDDHGAPFIGHRNRLDGRRKRPAHPRLWIRQRRRRQHAG